MVKFQDCTMVMACQPSLSQLGTGSVGLFWLAQQPPEASLTALEAQEESAELLDRTVKSLQLEQRVQVINGDLRNEP